MNLRQYVPEDAGALIAVYRDAALVLGRLAYTEEQARVWAMYPDDPDDFRGALSQGVTICAVADNAPVAFGQIHPADHIAYLYCHSAHARRGYASAILARLEEQAKQDGIAAVRVEASAVARPLFEKAGYHVTEEERPVRHGVEFLRFKMQKELSIRSREP
jgi:putative acetyltransferase